MNFHKYIITSLCFLFLSCSGSKDVVAIIKGEKIYLSEIYHYIDKAVFTAFNPEKKYNFVRKYAVHKILTTHSQLALNHIGLNIGEEKHRYQNDFIIQEVEKYIFNEMMISDSIVEFVKSALNEDVYVKTITVSHAFAFGKGNIRAKADAKSKAKTINNRLSSGELSYEEALSIYGESPVAKIRGNEMGQLSFGLMPKVFNDAVWSSGAGLLPEPLETSLGFQVIIVDHKIPKSGKNKREYDNNKLKNELLKGKYGYKEAHFFKFMDSLYEKYNASEDDIELYSAWNSVKEIEGVRSISGIPVSKLKNRDLKKNVLGRIGQEAITLHWILNKTNEFSFYKNVYIKDGFTFKKLISDVIARYLLVEWYNDNKKLFPNLDKTIKRKTVNKIYTLYLDKMQEQNPDLTKEIIMNRFLLEEDVSIIGF